MFRKYRFTRRIVANKITMNQQKNVEKRQKFKEKKVINFSLKTVQSVFEFKEKRGRTQWVQFIVSQRESFNVTEFWLFWSQKLDPAPGFYCWIPFLSNHKEFQKNTM